MAFLTWLLSLGSAGIFATITKTWYTWMQLLGAGGVGVVVHKLASKVFDKPAEPEKEMTEEEKKR